MATILTKIQLRRDTCADWVSNNPILLSGEAGVEEDTCGDPIRFKIGNGICTYTTLPYTAVHSVNSCSPSLADGSVTLTTDDVTEGSTNLYWTNNRFDTRLGISSITQLCDVNSATGPVAGQVLKWTGTDYCPTDDSGGVTSVNGCTGIVCLVTCDIPECIDLYYTDARSRSALCGGTGVTYDSATGEIAIGQDVATTSDVTFDDLIVTGNLTVCGDCTTLNTATLIVEDNTFILNSNQTGTPLNTLSAGMAICRGTSPNVELRWNEDTDQWEGTNDGSTFGPIINGEGGSSDPIFMVGVAQTGTPAWDGGVVLERGTCDNQAIVWDESCDVWTFFSTPEIGNTCGDVCICTLSDIKFEMGYGTAQCALYADLAEWYTADAEYEAGTVLEMGGTAEVTISCHAHTTRVIGVVSCDPAFVMNTQLEADTKAVVALRGRTPAKVTGKISKGDMLVSAGCGMAMASLQPHYGSVIGKALEDNAEGDTIIEIVVG